MEIFKNRLMASQLFLTAAMAALFSLSAFCFVEVSYSASDNDNSETIDLNRNVEPASDNDNSETIDLNRNVEPASDNDNSETIDLNRNVAPTSENDNLEIIDQQKEEKSPSQDESFEEMGAILSTSIIDSREYPDLQPYSRTGWDSKLVISNVTGTTTSASTIYDDEVIYVDYACGNFGTGDAGSFKYGLYIDRSLKKYVSKSSLAANAGSYVLDSNVGTLSAGSHTFMIKCDYNNDVTESNESNNDYSRTFTITKRDTAKPDLQPYSRTGWDSKLVISNVTGTTTSASTIYDDEVIYVDYACGNFGTGDAGSFKYGLYIDGSLKKYVSKSSLAANAGSYVLDSNVGTLSAGSHTFMIKCDYNNDVTESNESNNDYSRTFTITKRDTAKPDLQPYSRTGWDSKLVISNVTGTTTSASTIYDDEVIYVDYACGNFGTGDAGSFKYGLYIDGSLKKYVSKSSLAANAGSYVLDSNVGTLSAGSHTFMIKCDYNNDVTESNESNNDYSRTFTITKRDTAKPDLQPYSRTGWDSKLVISNVTGTTTSASTIYDDEVIYVDYACGNFGTGDAGSFKYGLYIDGSLKKYVSKSSLAANAGSYVLDSNVGTLSAGSHTFMIKCDYNNDVTESNESNNDYSRTFTITKRDTARPDLQPYSRTGWDSKLVISNVTGTTTSASTIYDDEVIYVDYACGNFGTGDAGSFKYGLYIDGSLKKYVSKSSLAANAGSYVLDSNVGTLSAGSHTFTIKCDYNDDVTESDESNNDYSRTFTITGGIPGSPQISIQPTSLTFTQNSEATTAKSEKKASLSACWVSFSPDSDLLSCDPFVETSGADEDGVSLKLLTKGMLVEKATVRSVVYDVLHLGKYNGELPAGQPNLPAVRKFIYVPKGKSSTIEADVGESLTFTDYYVYPVQLPQPDTYGVEAPPFVQDKDVYTKDEWLPKQMVSIGPVEVMRGHNIQLVSICPFQYNPAKKILRTFPEINVRLSFGGEKTRVDSRLRSTVFDSFVKGVVANPDSFDSKSSPTDAYAGENYLIITAPAFESQANSLASHKEGLGITTGVVTTAVSGTTSSQIKSYIQNAYNTHSPAPTYVLLLGDVETIPTTYDGTENIGTDLYYSTVDGSDYIPDLFLGRIPVDSSLEAETVINKIINYESDPPSLSSFYTNAVVAAYFQDGTPYTGTPDGYEDRRFVRTSEEVRDFLMDEGYSIQRIYCAESGATPTNYNNGYYGNGEALPSSLLRANGFAWDGDSDDISAAIESGAFLMLHRDHGMDRNYVDPDDGWSYSHTGWGDPYFVETHISTLNNGNLLPVVLSMNCQTGWFDGETDHNASRNFESFCELFLRKSGGGAVGLFGATRSSYSGYNDFMAEGMIDCVWPDFLPDIPNNSGANAHLGAMLNHGKLAMDQLWGSTSKRQEEYELFHVFGDPSLEMLTSGGGGDENTFTISNLGSADLEISSMAKRDGDSWLSWTPSAPLTISSGASRVVTVSVDWTQVSGSTEDERIIVSSNDSANSPYPDAVIINASKNANSGDPYVSKDGECGGKTPCYSSIQSAIDSASDGAGIKIEGGTYSETVVLNTSKSIKLEGGWDTSFTTQTGSTTLTKAPKALQGSLTLQNLSIKP